MYKSIRPGKFWYDTEGKLIQAHAPTIVYCNGKFWWCGENKENITGLARGEFCNKRHHGVKLYSSDDLYNWRDEGFLAAESEDASHPLFPENIVDRPHILYNRKTGNYVMWLKTGKKLDFEKCTFTIYVGKDLKTMRFLKEKSASPHNAGDFDLFETDGKAYIVFENPHKEMILRELDEEYTGLGEKWSSHLRLGTPPFIREAPCFFERGGRKYLLTSGTTSYFPNPTICYDITDLHGEWKDLGLTCVNDKNKNSFRAQYASVFRHPLKKDLYIALGDRWLTDCTEDMVDMEQVFLGWFKEGEGLPLPREERWLMSELDVSLATYVWLPISFKADGTPYIEWKREWKVENFE